VKVLDAAEVPEKKSFPPRLLFILLGTLFAFCFASVWVLVSTRWQEVDAEDPGKRLARDVIQTMQETPWVARTISLVTKTRLRAGSNNRNGSGEREQK
jgi:hypothetical protein